MFDDTSYVLESVSWPTFNETDVNHNSLKTRLLWLSQFTSGSWSVVVAWQMAPLFTQLSYRTTVSKPLARSVFGSNFSNRLLMTLFIYSLCRQA